MSKAILLKGSCFTLSALRVNNECLVETFISSLPEKDQNQLVAQLKYIADNGPPHNEEKFKKLVDDVFQIKTRRGIRVLCFFDGEKSLLLTHGFPKPKSKVLRVEISKAIEWRKDYFKNKVNLPNKL